MNVDLGNCPVPTERGKRLRAQPLHKGAFNPILLHKRTGCTAPAKVLCSHFYFVW